VFTDNPEVSGQESGRGSTSRFWVSSHALEGQKWKWFDQISCQWESQKNLFAMIYFGKIQFFYLPEFKISRSCPPSLICFPLAFYFFQTSFIVVQMYCRIFENTYVFHIYFVYVHF
jgi:hypothetical protein